LHLSLELFGEQCAALAGDPPRQTWLVSRQRGQIPTSTESDSAQRHADNRSLRKTFGPCATKLAA
jgi:hypothetical protein